MNRAPPATASGPTVTCGSPRSDDRAPKVAPAPRRSQSAIETSPQRTSSHRRRRRATAPRAGHPRRSGPTRHRRRARRPRRRSRRPPDLQRRRQSRRPRESPDPRTRRAASTMSSRANRRARAAAPASPAARVRWAASWHRRARPRAMDRAPGRRSPRRRRRERRRTRCGGRRRPRRAPCRWLPPRRPHLPHRQRWRSRAPRRATTSWPKKRTKARPRLPPRRTRRRWPERTARTTQSSQRADRLFAEGRWAEAAALYRELLRRNPRGDDAERWRRRLVAAENADVNEKRNASIAARRAAPAQEKAERGERSPHGKAVSEGPGQGIEGRRDGRRAVARQVRCRRRRATTDRRRR